MRYCRSSTGWVRVSDAYWRACVVQEEPQSDERWNVRIYCALQTPPHYGAYDRAYLLHAGGEPYSAPLEASIHRAERWYWKAALGWGLDYGPGHPQSEFERASGIPAADNPLSRSGGVAHIGVSPCPDRGQTSAFHSTLPVLSGSQWHAASVVRDSGTREWGVRLSGDTEGWLEAGGSPYRAPATVCAQRAERWYWQLVCGTPMPHSDDFPQSRWEHQNQIPDLDDTTRVPQPAWAPAR